MCIRDSADTASAATSSGGQAARLAQLAFVFELITGENAADTGLTDTQLFECMLKATCRAPCRGFPSTVCVSRAGVGVG